MHGEKFGGLKNLRTLNKISSNNKNGVAFKGRNNNKKKITKVKIIIIHFY